MTETKQDPKVPEPPKRVRKPKVPKKPGKPRKKSATKRNEAHARVVELIAARAMPDRVTTRLAIDCLIRAWIDHETLLAEPDLQDLMWVEYRHKTPLERTERFTQEYIAAYRRAYARYCGSEVEASRKEPCEPEFVRNDIGDMNCLWKARATADVLGVPYDMYLDTIMDGKLDNGKWDAPPLPNQLYAAVDPARLRDRPTPAEIGARLYGANWDHRFFADAYRGDPVQEAALDLLRADVWDAPDPAYRLVHYLVDCRAITEARARAMFGPDLVDAAITLGGKPGAPLGGDAEPYQPNCFGYPHGGPTSPCWTCPLVWDCCRHVEEVRAMMRATIGTDNPRLARERAQAADRQRRWYANQKQKAAQVMRANS